MTVYENICRVPTAFVVVRVWFAREQSGPHPRTHQDLLEKSVAAATFNPKLLADVEALAEWLVERLGGKDVVNAIEVTSPQGGMLIYPEWP